MAPPTGSEQLIRDYLNRLSVAARDLAPDDRRALLERIRGLIEQKADLANRPSTMDVGRVLARLGDPVRLVEQERRRLAAQGRSPRTTQPVAPATPARQRFLARALGREHGRLRGPSFGWPIQPDSRISAPVAPSNGVANGIRQPEAPTESDSQADVAANPAPATVPEIHAEPSPSARAPHEPSPLPPASVAAAADRSAGASRQADADESASADGPAPVSSPPSANGAAHVAAAQSGAESPQPEQPSAAPRQGSPDSRAVQQPADAVSSASGAESDDAAVASPAEVESAAAADSATPGSAADAADARPEDRRWRHPRAAALRRPVRRQLSRLFGWARKQPLEAAAIVVMGIGGPIFPPVFLFGAALALASELWDGRDKWVGLALPIVLTAIGLAVGVAAGGRAHWMHESWVYLNVVSRVAPALGAGYLAWRSRHGPRPSSAPPFIRPYRAS